MFRAKSSEQGAQSIRENLDTDFLVVGDAVGRVEYIGCKLKRTACRWQRQTDTAACSDGCRAFQRA